MKIIFLLINVRVVSFSCCWKLIFVSKGEGGKKFDGHVEECFLLKRILIALSFFFPREISRMKYHVLDVKHVTIVVDIREK